MSCTKFNENVRANINAGHCRLIIPKKSDKQKKLIYQCCSDFIVKILGDNTAQIYDKELIIFAELTFIIRMTGCFKVPAIMVILR